MRKLNTCSPTLTRCSWLNLVEKFFAIITRQAIRRGSFPSVDDLIAAIRTYIDAYNEHCEPFTWTKTADEILTKLKPQNNFAAPTRRTCCCPAL